MKVNNKIIMLPAFIILLLGSIGLMIIYALLGKDAEERVKLELAWLAKSAMTSLVLSEKPLTIENIDFIARQQSDASGARITFIDVEGTVKGDSNVAFEEIPNMSNHLNRVEIKQAHMSGQGYSQRYSDTLQQNFYYVAIYKQIEIKGNKVGFYSRASFSSDTFYEQKVEMLFTLLLILIVGVFVMAIMTVVATRWISRLNEAERLALASEVEVRNIEIEQMHELDSLLSACGGLKDAKEVTRQLIPSLLTGSQGAISVYKSSRNKLKTQMFWGELWRDNSYFSPSQCWALRKGHKHLINQSDNSIACEHYSDLSDNSFLCIPMIAHGETIGVMHVIKKDIDKKTETLAIALAKRMGTAIANIELKYSLRQQAIKDTLTNLYNRRYLFETLEQLAARAIRKATPIGIIMVDIDHFKKLNDTYGHDAGDLVLKDISLYFKQSTRASDVVCRYGGEEFCIVCPETTQADTLAIANKLCEGVRELRIKISPTEKISITFSAGVSAFYKTQESLESIITQADQALYQAKHEGRDRVKSYKNN